MTDKIGEAPDLGENEPGVTVPQPEAFDALNPLIFGCAESVTGEVAEAPPMAGPTKEAA
jgi:hypothetical protein